MAGDIKVGELPMNFKMRPDGADEVESNLEAVKASG